MRERLMFANILPYPGRNYLFLCSCPFIHGYLRTMVVRITMPHHSRMVSFHHSVPEFQPTIAGGIGWEDRPEQFTLAVQTSIRLVILIRLPTTFHALSVVSPPHPGAYPPRV
jgi:hypothetical protein